MKYDEVLSLVLAKGGGGGGGPQTIIESSENLLDNPFFTINQRKATSGSAPEGIYIVDRWRTSRSLYNCTGGIIFKWDGAHLTSGVITQRTGRFDLIGKTVTLSAIIDGTLYSDTVVVATTSVSGYFNGQNWGYSIGYDNTYGTVVNIYNYTQTYCTVSAVKLELGSTSTLAGDIAPDYPSELEKCQYYFERIEANANFTLDVGLGNGTTLPFNVKIKPKRKACTISRSGEFKLGQDQASINVTALAINTQSINSGDVQLTATASNTSGQLYRFIMVQGAILDFDAEL